MSRAQTLVGRSSSGSSFYGSPRLPQPPSPVSPRFSTRPVSPRFSISSDQQALLPAIYLSVGELRDPSANLPEHNDDGFMSHGRGHVGINQYVNGSAYGSAHGPGADFAMETYNADRFINGSAYGSTYGPGADFAENLREKQILLEPVNVAMSHLRSGCGMTLDLLQDDGEYVMSTLGLSIEDDTVTYITPAGPAHLSGSVQLGDRVVAVDKEAVSADTILECLSKNNRIGNLCRLTLERRTFHSAGPVTSMLDVKLPRSSRPFVSRAEHMVGLLEEHRRILDLKFHGQTTELHTSLDIIFAHLLECESKRIQWVRLVFACSSD